MNQTECKFNFPVSDKDFKTSSCTHPGGSINRCVKIAIRPEGVAIRDSKDKGNITLFFRHDEWDAFLRGAKEGQFER